ncbi:MAG: PcfJ domain-containing protein [Muribaculaceae bacterium]|nr:PcfJ domain-containing protein [Muribaculaceae bacterium]
MKPRNKKQQEILALSGQLRPLTPSQKKWALNYTISHYGFRLKSGMCTCMKCGHEWMEKSIGKHICPKCGSILEIKDTKQRVIRDKSYFNVITTMGGYQVVRMFLMIVEMRKGMKANPAFLEIGQYWIDDKGRTTVVGLQRTLGHYVDTFAFGSPLEIRHDNDAFHFIAGEWVYPKVNVTDTIKRNGFKTSTYYIHPVTLFQQLLTNPYAETLIKSNDIEMLKHLCLYPEDVNKYWDSIKIAKRAGYKFKDIGMWFDYIKMLENMDKDLKSPSLIAPKDLKTAHDIYVEKVNRKRAKERMLADRKRAEEDKAKFEELKGRYIGLSMTDGKINLHTLDSVAEYFEQGESQHICVGTSKYYLKAETLVFTATMGGKTIATVEISLNDYSILQCRAFANDICKYAEEIADIINANKKLIADRKRA